MTNQTPPARPPELIRFERLGAALGKLPRDGDTWKALEEIITREFGAEAREKAHSPETPEDKRAFWNGADHSMFELWKTLQELQSGAWKQWPTAARMIQENGDEE